MGVKRAGTGRASLVERLLDEYESIGVVDTDHEYDIKMIGAIMYSGKAVSSTPSQQQVLTTSCSFSWS